MNDMCAQLSDRITGRSTSSDTARTTRSTSSPGASGGTWSGGTGMPSGATGASGVDATSGTAMSAGTMPGVDTTRMRGSTLPATSGRGMPTFLSHNECRTGLSQQGRGLDRGPAAGGEVSMADMGPCRNQPRSRAR